MTPPIALCADSESIRHPELMGLAGENLAAQEWLRLFTTAEEARRFLLHDRSVGETWVAGCDDIEPINLAATLKHDRSDMRVCLLTFQGTGSLMSRVSAAGIDASLTQQAFAERYAEAKRRHAASLPGASAGSRAQRAAQAAALSADYPPHAGDGAQGVAATGTRPLRDRAFPTHHEGVLPAPGDRQAAPCRPAFVLPVVSGSGGAGKSTIAVLSALFAQGLGYRTLLLDFDLQFGDMRELAGCSEALAIDEALAAPERLARLAPDGLVPAVLAAPRQLENAESVVQRASQLLDDVQGRFEVIVANTGAAWAEHHALLLERCSKALFLVDQRPSSLRACRHALDLCARCGIATGPFLFAANRCAKGALLTSIDVSCALKGASAVELREGGREVEELMGAGQPLDLISAKNDLCTSLEHVLVDILPGCEGRALRMAEPREGRFERRFGWGRRRGKKDAPCLY